MGHSSLLIHFIKIAWRNIRRYFSYSFLNIAGLSIAISVFYILMLFVNDEFSYDKFHHKSHNVYRVISKIKTSGMETAMSAQPWGPNLFEDFSEVESYTRSSFYNENVPIEHGDDIIFEEKILFVDSLFFDVFTYSLQKGTRSEVLDDLYDVVITQSMADKYFGDRSAVGEHLRVSFNGEFRTFVVSGIAEDPPKNAHHTFNMLFSKQMEYDVFPVDQNNWRLHNNMTYIRLREGVTENEMEARFEAFFNKHAGKSFVNRYLPSLQPITDIHLKSDLFEELAPNGNINYVKIALAMAIFILLIGVVNYVNLSTALSVKRAREVGSRKVFGAVRADLIGQFLTESLVITFIAVLLSILIITFSLPYFNQISGKDLNFLFADHYKTMLSIVLVVGLLSGIYPAVFISGFKPLEVLKGKFQNSTKGLSLRRTLIICQFSLSIILFIGTGVIYEQISFIRDKELGFSPNNRIIAYGAPNRVLVPKFDELKNDLMTYPGVRNVAMTSGYPGSVGQARRYKPEDYVGSDESLASVQTIYSDYNFPEILNLQFIAGRSFDKSLASDSNNFIINEAAAKLFGYHDPVGRTLTATERGSGDLSAAGRIIGMVKDFHFESFHSRIEPLVISIEAENYYNVILEYEGGSEQEMVTYFQEAWKKQYPNEAFSSRVLSDHFNDLHTTEFQLQRILTACSVLAIVIACLGLFGLATFLAQQKVKEIGIRKVLGASRTRIMLMLNKEFSIPILFALVIGAGAAYYLMDLWLQEFAYRVSFNWWLIPLAGLISLGVASLTVSFNSIKTSSINPAKVLRSE